MSWSPLRHWVGSSWWEQLLPFLGTVLKTVLSPDGALAPRIRGSETFGSAILAT